jgi:hypothetical protein
VCGRSAGCGSRGLIRVARARRRAYLWRAQTEARFMASHPSQRTRRMGHPDFSKGENASAGLDVLFAAEAKAGPVLVDGY